jgi:hypothetical protein
MTPGSIANEVRNFLAGQPATGSLKKSKKKAQKTQSCSSDACAESRKTPSVTKFPVNAATTLVFASLAPRVVAQMACPSSCYRSHIRDNLEISAAAAACAELLPPAGAIACGMAMQEAIEREKRRCAAINCGPFYSD